uniref:Uncharacterized protein n=1 Tax=Lepeophtheirus salmonis TaxID=72036 RepID=A0A0K2TD19_LEPSM
MAEDDPTRSMKAMARDLVCHEKTIRDCVPEDLRCSSYKMLVGQILISEQAQVPKAARDAVGFL